VKQEPEPEAIQSESHELDDGALARAGGEMFSWVRTLYVDPEIQSRQERGLWPEGTGLYRFQVQFPEAESPKVRLNDEVKGILEVKAAGPVEEGQLVTEDDFSEITDYKPLDEDAGIPHVTGFAHRDSWFLGYQLAHRHPARHEHLAAGREFLAAAHTALAEGHPRVVLDAANSAAELFVKAELLSCGPVIEMAEKARSHDGLSMVYNLWGRLGNTDARFVDALNRLRRFRSDARYLKGELQVEVSEMEGLLATLGALELHAQHLVEAPLHELPPKYTVIATRELKAGELIGPDASTIFPPRQAARQN
jgi:hypothetical protein